jgi:hypothetical protein
LETINLAQKYNCGFGVEKGMREGIALWCIIRGAKIMKERRQEWILRACKCNIGVDEAPEKISIRRDI